MHAVFPLSALALPLLFSAPVAQAAPPAGSAATLAVLETTDLHATVLSYDYYKLKAEPAIGLERTATLIRQARAEFPNTLLLDNGDAIQGTALADYQALVAPPPCERALAIYRVLDALTTLAFYYPPRQDFFRQGQTGCFAAPGQQGFKERREGRFGRWQRAVTAQQAAPTFGDSSKDFGEKLDVHGEGLDAHCPTHGRNSFKKLSGQQ